MTPPANDSHPPLHLFAIEMEETFRRLREHVCLLDLVAAGLAAQGVDQAEGLNPIAAELRAIDGTIRARLYPPHPAPRTLTAR